MRILNFGAGAVGLGIDSFLLKAGQSVDILGRPNTVSALKAQGLKRTGIFGDFQAAAEGFGCFEALDKLPGQAYDFILVCVKSPDSKQAADQIARYKKIYNQNTKIVLVPPTFAYAQSESRPNESERRENPAGAMPRSSLNTFLMIRFIMPG